jgi:hypothetical protein
MNARNSVYPASGSGNRTGDHTRTRESLRVGGGSPSLSLTIGPTGDVTVSLAPRTLNLPHSLTAGDPTDGRNWS